MAVVRQQVRYRDRLRAAAALAVVCVLLSPACRGSATTVVLVPSVDAGSEWVIWDLDPAIGWEKCELHGTHLTTAVVPTRWGYAPPETFDRGFLSAEGELFPHANESVEGGCIPSKYTHARVKHCWKCAEAKAQWLSEHPNVDASGHPRLTGR